MQPRRRFHWSRPVLGFVGLLTAYYAFPVRLGDSLGVEILGLVLTVAALGLVIWMMTKEFGRQRRGETLLSMEALSMLLVLLVMSFSLAFYLLNEIRPSEIPELQTRTDALYFTLSTMATVGYGDVHAEGQLARAMVSGLIVFNVVVVAALVRTQTSRRSESG
ncbi:membrane hypothetical protein [metagenome]|uniref:Potassium channel domain-containing protein n=1 Tax=metagenome TaxID=256318 RepID=A0A2P2BYY9_9ZZZZ